MCGFSGLYSKTGFDISDIKLMNDLIRHRGPDGEGYFVTDRSNHSFFINGKSNTSAKDASAPLIEDLVLEHKSVIAALGHRRLSIVDLSENGQQPMVSNDGRHIIAFNGEIYNHNEIRVELESVGFEFRSTSDTEVLLKAYLHWGKDVLIKLNGMFAFQVYDPISNTLFCARDRFGVKPLYYWLHNDQLAIASEIKQFTCLPDWQSTLNTERAYDFLKYGLTEHTNETLFDGVCQLKPGHYFEINLNKALEVVPCCWYQLPNENSRLDLDGAKIKFKELFSNAVKLRLQADVPVGTGLSGGLDSSSIACEINSLLKQSEKTGLQKTFSACTNVKRYSERNYIDDVLKKIDAEPHFVYPEPPSELNLINDIIWHQDEPFGTTSIMAEWSVFKLAKQNGVKVTIDGHGADETLAGYHKFFFIYLVELLSKGNIFRFMKEAKALKRNHGYAYKKIIKAVIFYYRNSSNTSSEKDNWFLPKISRVKQIQGELTLRAESMTQLSTLSVPMQLHWCDRDSMAHSVESRAPFLDVNLVEFIVSCPSKFKINNGMSKFILRESLQRLLPKNIYQRIGKIGFATPEEEWVTKDKSSFFLKLLDEAAELTEGILSDEAFDISRKIVNGELPYNGFAWRVICFSKWIEIFNVKTKVN